MNIALIAASLHHRRFLSSIEGIRASSLSRTACFPLSSSNASSFSSDSVRPSLSGAYSGDIEQESVGIEANRVYKRSISWHKSLGGGTAGDRGRIRSFEGGGGCAGGPVSGDRGSICGQSVSNLWPTWTQITRLCDAPGRALACSAQRRPSPAHHGSSSEKWQITRKMKAVGRPWFVFSF